MVWVMTTASLQLYDLRSFEVLWEKAEDTKALLAWSSERIVLSFRGTASWANVLADLRFWLKGGFSSFCGVTSARQCAYALWMVLAVLHANLTWS
jgi:hypothetical protein